MKTYLEFFVPGPPVPKGRPRFSRRNGSARTPVKTKEYEERIRSVASYEALLSHRAPLEGPVEIQITIIMLRPKSQTKAERAIRFCAKRPDMDNIEKAILDALNGIAYKDDGQVCKKQTVKIYGDQPGVGVRIGKAEE